MKPRKKPGYLQRAGKYNYCFSVTVDKKTSGKLLYASEKLGMSKTQIVRRALRFYFDYLDDRV